MAVQTETRRAPAVSSNGHAPKVRLHSEILPPDLGPATPVAVRTSRRALGILAVGIVVVQFISAPLGHKLNSIARTGTDVYSVWQHYLATPVPDVLVVGASNARTDVDEPSLDQALSRSAGRGVTVEKMGFAGQTPMFIDALMYRVMKRNPHPKLVVFVMLGPELNSGCVLCNATVNGGLWDITDLTDPDFVKLALKESPNPGWLVAGWAVPVFAYYPSLIAVQCLFYQYGRSAAASVAGTVPRQLQNPTACESTVPYRWPGQYPMDSLDYQGSVNSYTSYMANFSVSEDTFAAVKDMVGRARDGGAQVAFLETPLHPDLLAQYPGLTQKAAQNVELLAGRLNLPVIDLRTSVPGDPSLWVDALHLDRPGADYLAPQLAGALSPLLTGS